MALFQKPANLTPIANSAQTNVALTSATALTVPTGARFALIQAQTQNVRWKDDGTNPTTSAGMLLAANSDLFYTGDLSKLKFIAATSGGTITVLYYA